MISFFLLPKIYWIRPWFAVACALVGNSESGNPWILLGTFEPWEDSSSSGPLLQTLPREVQRRAAMIIGPGTKGQTRPSKIPVPAAQGCRDPEAVVTRSGARRILPTPSNSGGPCHSRPRPQIVAWRNDALASRVMFRALCMMNLMRLTMPKMPCKWLCYLIITLHILLIMQYVYRWLKW